MCDLGLPCGDPSCPNYAQKVLQVLIEKPPAKHKDVEYSDYVVLSDAKPSSTAEQNSAQLEARRKIHKYVSFVLTGSEDADVQAAVDEAKAHIESLTLALERTLDRFENLLARKPIRDVEETIAEARRALKEK